MDKINDLKIDIQKLIIENKESEEEIDQYKETHSRAVINYVAKLKSIQKKTTVMKKEKETGDVEQEGIGLGLHEERIIL